MHNDFNAKPNITEMLILRVVNRVVENENDSRNSIFTSIIHSILNSYSHLHKMSSVVAPLKAAVVFY